MIFTYIGVIFLFLFDTLYQRKRKLILWKIFYTQPNTSQGFHENDFFRFLFFDKGWDVEFLITENSSSKGWKILFYWKGNYIFLPSPYLPFPLHASILSLIHEFSCMQPNNGNYCFVAVFSMKSFSTLYVFNAQPNRA